MWPGPEGLSQMDWQYTSFLFVGNNNNNNNNNDDDDDGSSGSGSGGGRFKL